MKVGDKVKVKDGSYMMTIRDGQLTTIANSKRYHCIGKCKDEFTVIATGLKLPTPELYKHLIVNDTIIINDMDGSIWYCSKEVNLKSINEVKEMTMAEIIGILGYEIKIKK